MICPIHGPHTGQNGCPYCAPQASNLVSPRPGDKWCRTCSCWVAPHNVSLSNTHDSYNDGCGYQVYEQSHPCFEKGLPTAENPRHD